MQAHARILLFEKDNFIKVVTFLVAVITSLPVFSQVGDTISISSVRSAVKDSTHNYFLTSATASVYDAQTNALIGYSIANNEGIFKISGVPIGPKLKLVVSYVGYHDFARNFSIPRQTKIYELETIYLQKANSEMEAVVVTVPPLLVKGDTLEFNAAAFHLDQNAVAEDLLRKLPSVIVWGDGTITVNGRKINQLLVNGKPFFGGDAIVATQNIPKNAIDKIQVYRDRIDPSNPFDSITTVDIRLRKTAGAGVFGKVSASGGTDNRYDGDASLSYFNANTQLSSGIMANNVNKGAADLNTILKNSTFKGVNARIDYQPNFNLPGITVDKSGGILFQHDFIDKPDAFNNNRFSGSGYMGKDDSHMERFVQTITSLSKDSALYETNNTIVHGIKTFANLNAAYNKRWDNKSFSVLVTAGNNRNKENNQEIDSVQTITKALISRNAMFNDLDERTGNVHGGAIFRDNSLSSMDKIRVKIQVADYAFDFNNDHTLRQLQAKFVSNTTPSQSQGFQRNYDISNNVISHQLNLGLNNLMPALFPNNRLLSSLTLIPQNFFSYQKTNYHNTIVDYDTSFGKQVLNPNLTYQGNYSFFQELPSLLFGKTKVNLLANRYQKTLNWNLGVGMLFTVQKNTSSIVTQNFSENYRHFIPSASLTYTNFHFNDYLDKYEAIFNSKIEYPTINQRISPPDSTNSFNIQYGNLLLRPAKNISLKLSYRHDLYGVKNTFNYGGNLGTSVINDFVGDSLTVDPNGRYLHRFANVNGYRQIRGDAFLNKAFKFNKNLVQFNIKAGLKMARVPGYAGFQIGSNVQEVISNTFLNSDTIGITYSYSDKFIVNFTQGVNIYRSSQQASVTNDYHNLLSSSRIGLGYNLSKRIMLGSNVTETINSSSVASTTNFCIWNADISLRLTRGNNLEIKAAALDMLHQNKGIINYGSANFISHGYTNALQQYFMLSVSYFPRYFHKKVK